MIRSKTLWLLILSTFLVAGSYAQDMKWLLGTWTGPVSKAGKFHMSRSIVIDSVSGENFSGTRTNEADDDNHTKIVTAINGHFNEDQFLMRIGEVLYKKDPPHDAWVNCSACPSYNKINIKHDTVFLNCQINGCSKFCDGISVYYKLLPDYDTTTQRQLVDLFADSSYAAKFKPYDKIAMQQQKAIDDSLKIAAAIALKRQQQVDDSLKNVAAIAARRQQQADDSLKAVAMIAAKRQQQVADSLKNAAIIASKQHEQHVKDSIKTATALEKQRQQHVNDSVNNVALLAAARQKQINDSLRNATILAKQRQKQADDSLKVVAALAVKRQKQVDDSLKAVAALAAKRQKQVDDSLKAVAAKRQKQVDDSLKAVASKRQKQIDDSLANAALIAKKRQQQIDDSLKNAAIVAQKQQQHIDDSLKRVTAASSKNPNDPAASIPASKALEQRTNVLVQSFHITTPDILIELFDNAQIDGDMVSVYHNNELIVNKQKLLRDAITLHIHADSVNREHEFILIADNLGTIPPNTALMRITAGNQRYQLNVKTDLSNNAKIILYYDGN